jgi:hypothetical protein
MRALVLYHPQSDHVGLVEGFVSDFARFKGRLLEKVSLETREGADLATLYDIMQYPAILVIGPDGKLQRAWQGGVLPLMDEVESYMHGLEPVNRQAPTIQPAHA